MAAKKKAAKRAAKKRAGGRSTSGGAAPSTDTSSSAFEKNQRVLVTGGPHEGQRGIFVGLGAQAGHGLVKFFRGKRRWAPAEVPMGQLELVGGASE